MGLSNVQYEEIMRGYQSRQLQNQHLTQERWNAIYTKFPQLKSINDQIASLSVEAARKRLNNDISGCQHLKDRIEALREEKRVLLKSNGFDEDILEPIYTCKDCKDTGYSSGGKCHCFKQKIINVVYSQSNIKNILAQENFNTFSYKYYSGDKIDPATGLSSLEIVRVAVEKCRFFIDDFGNSAKNIFFYGDTGVGKTFLSNCIAKELLAKGYSVIYFTAFQLFDILSKGVFDRDADAIAAHQNIFDCDLLIIDDLGTELTNNFSSSQFFSCLNERILRKKSFIISTNLSLQELRDRYSDRIFSRITSNFKLCKITGPDIRMYKKRLINRK